MPKELCHLLRNLEFLAEDTASLQGLLKSLNHISAIPLMNEINVPLAHRSTYIKITTVDIASQLPVVCPHVWHISSLEIKHSFTATGTSSC